MRKLILFIALISSAFLSCSKENKVEEAVAGGNGIAGDLYLRTQIGSSSSLQITWIFLGTDGTIIKNPRLGVNPLDKDKETAINPASVGKYTQNGDKMDITWNDGSKQSLNVQYKDGKMSGYDGGVCTVAKSFSADSFPNEVYTGQGAFGGGTLSEYITLTLNSDKTYIWFSRIYVQQTGTWSEKTENGTYTLNKNTLRLIAPNGASHPEYFTVQPYDMGNQIDLILGQSHFKRKL